MIYDIAIIGAGPAGMIAAIYAVRKGLNTLIISKDVGGQVGTSGEIENYLGFETIDGNELVGKFKAHVKKFNQIDFIEGKRVISLTQSGNNFKLVDQDKKEYQSRMVIIATGRQPRWLNIPGEAKFKGRGISACATCDAPFFKGKDVIVVGGGNSGLESAELLTKFANKITVVTNIGELTGDRILIDRISNKDSIEVLYDSELVEVEGEKFVEAVKIKDLKTDKINNLKTSGVFVEIGYVPSPQIEELTEKEKDGAIKVNSDFETNVPGLFAAGDSNNLWGEQIIIAAGEGAKAAMQAAKYLSSMEKL